MIAFFTVEIPPFVIALAVALTFIVYICTGLIIVLALYSWNKSTRQHIAKFANRLSSCASKLTLSNLYENELANIKIKVQAKLKATYERSHHNRYIYWNQSRLYYNNNKVCNEELNNSSDNLRTEKRNSNSFKSKREISVITKNCNEFLTNMCHVDEWEQNQQELQFELEPLVANIVKQVETRSENDKKSTVQPYDSVINKSHVTNRYLSTFENESTNHASRDDNNNSNVDDTINLFNWEGTEYVSEFNYNYVNEARPFLLPAITIPVVVSPPNTTHASSIKINNVNGCCSNDNNMCVMDNNKQNKEFTHVVDNASEMRETSKIAALQNGNNKVNKVFSLNSIAISQDASSTKHNSPRFTSSSSSSLPLSLPEPKTLAATQNIISKSNIMQTEKTINMEDHSESTAAYSKSTCMSSLSDNHCNYGDVFDNDNNESKLEFTSTAVITSDTNSLSNDEFSDHTTNDQKTCSSVEENEVVDEVKDTVDCLEQLKMHEMCTVHACNNVHEQDEKICVDYSSTCKPYAKDENIEENSSHSVSSSYAIYANTHLSLNGAHESELKVQAHEGKTSRKITP